MLIAFTIVAIFIAWIWVDYFRLIDIYEKESLLHFLLLFFGGALSVFIVFAIDDLIPVGIFELNGNAVNDFLFCVFKIGAVEEFAKLVPFALALLLLKKHINEPIDYLAYISTSALGFAAAENVLYFQSHGAQIIIGRSILSAVGHMMFTSFIAYGIILYKYRSEQSTVLHLLFYFLIAAFAHGFYDYWLISASAPTYGILVTIAYFLFNISIYATILNNALNNSEFFTYKKVVNQSKVATRLMIYYAILMLAQTLILAITGTVKNAIENFTASLFTAGFIIVITSVRLSRFKLIKEHWYPLQLTLPFSIVPGNKRYNSRPRAAIRIKGDSYNEAVITSFFDTPAQMLPINNTAPFSIAPFEFTITDKTYLDNETPCFMAHKNGQRTIEWLLITPISQGKQFTNERHPMVNVFKLAQPQFPSSEKLTPQHSSFIGKGAITQLIS